MAETSSKATDPTALTPKGRYIAKLEEVIGREKAVGAVIVRGLPPQSKKRKATKDPQDGEEDEDEEEDDDGDDEDDGDNATEEEISHLRHAILTKARQKLLKKIQRKFVGPDDDILMTNTESSYEVIDGIAEEVAAASKKRLPGQFDHLFAITSVIERFNFWYEDTDIPEIAVKNVKILGKAWKALLAHTDAQLGIDPEFTRAATIALLENLAKELKEAREPGSGAYVLSWS